MSNRVTMGQDDSMMLQRDTLPMQVLNKLMDWIMDGKLKMVCPHRRCQGQAPPRHAQALRGLPQGLEDSFHAELCMA